MFVLYYVFEQMILSALQIKLSVTAALQRDGVMVNQSIGFFSYIERCIYASLLPAATYYYYVIGYFCQGQSIWIIYVYIPTSYTVPFTS